jgi:cytochrome c-type protein NapC
MKNEEHAGVLEDIRKGDTKCIDCHSGEKIHPRAFAHGGNGRGPSPGDPGAPKTEGKP